MPDDRIQECITIDKDNINIIGNALEEYWSHAYHDAHTINQINDTRVRIKQIKEKMRKLNEIKICWG